MTVWKVYIDWARNADFNGTYDEIWDDVVEMSWGAGMDKAYQNMAGESACSITVRNVDGKYNPDNAASPLAGLIAPFRPVKITATVDDIEMTLWRGWLDKVSTEWSPAGAQSGNITAVLGCVGAKQLMQEAELSLPLQENKRGDEIVAFALDQVVLPPSVFGGWLLHQDGYSELGQSTILASETDYSELEQGVMSFRYYGDIRAIDKEDEAQPLSDRRHDQNAYRVIRDVTEGERGHFFFNRAGKAVWWNRDHLIDTAAQTGVIDSDGVLGPRPASMQVSYGSSLANRVQVMAYQRVEGTTITLWSLSEPITLAANESRIFYAPFSDENGAQVGAVDNVAAANIVNTGDLEIDLDTKADRARVTVTANTQATLTSFDIEGTLLSSTNRIVILQEDAASIRDYGRRRMFKLNLRTINNHQDAREIAEFELRRRNVPRTEVEATSFISNADGIVNAHQLAWNIGDRIRVNAGEIGHDAAYYIIGERHKVYGGGQVHESTFVLEPVAFTRLTHYGKQYRDAWVRLKADDNVARLGQQFQIADDYDLSFVRVFVNRVSSPTLNYRARICADDVIDDGWQLETASKSEVGSATILNSDGAFPGSVLASSDVIAASEIEDAVGWIEFTLPEVLSLSGGTPYWLVLEADDPDLVSYWSLDEASGGRADSHGSNDLADNFTVTGATGLQGSAAQFTKANFEWLSIADAAQSGLDLSGDFTIAGWVTLDALPSVAGSMGIVSKWNFSGERSFALWAWTGDDKMYISLSNDGSTTGKQLASSDALTAGQRYFVCARYDLNNLMLRLNETDSTPAAYSSSIYNSANPFDIGRIGLGNYLDGSIDELGIWRRALTNAEVTYLYNLGRGRNYQAARAFPDASNYLAWGADGSSPSYASGEMRYLASGGDWLANGQDAIFEAYAA